MKAWIRGTNPLTYERPFQKRAASPLEAAVYASVLGPALLMPPEPMLWLLLLLLLLPSTLSLGLLGGRHRLHSRSGVRNLMLMLFLFPLLLHLLIPAFGLDAGSHELLWGGSLFLISHTSALLFFRGRSEVADTQVSSWMVRAAFWMLPVMILLQIPAFAHRFLPTILAQNLFVEAGCLRLVWMLFLLVIFQLSVRRLAHRQHDTSGGGR
jgi:hypothetical protein